MIDVSGLIKAKFQSDSTIKRYSLQFPQVTNTSTGEVEKPEKIISATGIKSESVTLTEPLCSEEQLKFGCNEAATFECEVEFEDESLTGRVFNVFLLLGDPDNENVDIFEVGRYYVDEEEIQSDRRTKSITAYDGNYIFNSLDVSTWAWELEMPMTVKQLRDSLFSYIGNVEQVERTLPNDSITLTKNPFAGERDISFETVITGLCEWNACFGHINRQGKFDYIRLKTMDIDETYPAKDLFPGQDVFPNSIRSKNYYISPSLIKSDITWQNYKCKTVDTIQIRNKSGAAILEYHIPEKTTYSNIYVIMSNWMTEAMDSGTLPTAVLNFANAIKDITYTPCDANIKMDLSLEVGDAITLTGTDGTRIPTYIFNRVATGDVSAFDEIEATGYEEWVNDPPDNDGALDGVIDDVNDLNDRLTDVESKQASGEGQITILSVKQLPASPQRNVLYLVQGQVYVQ